MNNTHLDLITIAKEGSDNIERILLDHLSNENNSIIVREAKEKLVEVYATGIFGFCPIEEGDPIRIPNCPDYNKIGNIIKTPDDVNLILPILSAHCEYFDIALKDCIEGALLSVSSNLADYDTELTAAETAKLILLCLYAFGKHSYKAGGYKCDPYAYYEVIHIPELKDDKKVIAIIKEIAVCPNRFEKFITALSKHFMAMDDRNKEFVKELLSCYQFGRVVFFCEPIEVPTLQNAEKAIAFANKNGLELLEEPYDNWVVIENE